MPQSGIPARLSIAVAFAALATTAHAESEYERGYREGYSRGFQDSHQARPATAKQWAPGGIVVIRAWYGDGNKACDLTSWAAGQFNSRTSGAVEVSNGLCGDVAPGKRKSLEIEYYCKGERKTASAYEHRRLEIYCY